MKRSILFVLVLVLVQFSAHANETENTCRESIVSSFASLGVRVDPQSFSSAKFEDLGLTVEEFNALNSQEQNTIYLKVKPMELVVQDAINALNSMISRYNNPFSAIMLADELSAWRENRDRLRACL